MKHTKTLIPGLLFVVLTGAALGACQPSRPVPTRTPAPPPASGVFVDPSFLEVSPGEAFEIRLAVTPGERGISGGEITLVFDPAAFLVLGVEPGDLLGREPLIGLLVTDNEAGKVRYALARKGATTAPTPSGVFAVIRMAAHEQAEPRDYGLELVTPGFADHNFGEIRGIQVRNGAAEIVP